MGHHQGGDTALGEHLPGFPAHALPQVLVQAGERFVEQQDGGCGRKRSQQCDALLLPAGERVRITRPQVCEVHVGKRTVDPRAVTCPVAQPEADVLLDREVGKQRVVLKHEAHAALLRRKLPRLPPLGHRRAVDRDVPGLQGIETGREPEQCGLSAPRRTEQAYELAGLDPDACFVDGKGLAEAMRDAGELEPVHRCFCRYAAGTFRWPGRERAIVRLITMTGTTPAATMVRAPSAHSSSSSSEAYW